MKSIVAELNQNIRSLEIEEDNKGRVRNSYIVRARDILKESIKKEGYDPATIRITTDRILIKKKEITVRFTLTPLGFKLKPRIKGECYISEPKITVHIYNDNTSSVYILSLKTALEILVIPYYWKIKD